jgi:hypothetical protein
VQWNSIDLCDSQISAEVLHAQSVKAVAMMHEQVVIALHITIIQLPSR